MTKKQRITQLEGQLHRERDVNKYYRTKYETRPYTAEALKATPLDKLRSIAFDEFGIETVRSCADGKVPDACRYCVKEYDSKDVVIQKILDAQQAVDTVVIREKTSGTQVDCMPAKYMTVFPSNKRYYMVVNDSEAGFVVLQEVRKDNGNR